MKTGTETYYARRATEYDRVYDKPERQDDLRSIAAALPPIFVGRDVLEVAAGTGYWTQFYADDAQSVTATDLNPEVLEVAKRRRHWTNVEFVVTSADQLEHASRRSGGRRSNAAFVGFFWSHLCLTQVPEFLAHLTTQLEPGSPMVFIDNHYVEGSNHPITRTDDAGNTFQTRMLEDGTEWEVLKNFPTADEIAGQLASFASDVEITTSEYFWQATARTRVQG